MMANLKRPATTVEASLEINESALGLDLTKLLLSNREQPGSVGHPGNLGIRISEFGIVKRKTRLHSNSKFEIRNFHLTSDYYGLQGRITAAFAIHR